MVNEKADTEEVNRFLKAIGLCRTCGHVKIAHSKTGKKIICLDVIPSKKDKYQICKCAMFVPKDNLEFLEWAAEQRKKDETVSRRSN